MRVPEGDFERVFLTVQFRPLGYEPTRVLARLFCSMIYVLLVGWFFLLLGKFCGRNVVGNRVWMMTPPCVVSPRLMVGRMDGAVLPTIIREFMGMV